MDLLQKLLKILACKNYRYLTLTHEDLVEWSSNPEEFGHTQEQLTPGDRLRPCAEAFLVSLVERYKATLAPVLVDMLREVREQKFAGVNAYKIIIACVSV